MGGPRGKNFDRIKTGLNTVENKAIKSVTLVKEQTS